MTSEATNSALGLPVDKQQKKSDFKNALMLLNKNLLWPSQMENVNRNNVKKLKSR